MGKVTFSHISNSINKTFVDTTKILYVGGQTNIFIHVYSYMHNIKYFIIYPAVTPL